MVFNLKIKIFYSCLSLVFFNIFLLGQAVAQDQNVKGGFFDDDFATNPLGSTETMVPEVSQGTEIVEPPVAPAPVVPVLPPREEVEVVDPAISNSQRIQNNAKSAVDQTREVLNKKFSLEENSTEEDYDESDKTNWAVTPSLGGRSDLDGSSNKVSYISLLVPIGPEQQLNWELNKLVVATRRSNVKIGEVVIVGLGKMKKAEFEMLAKREGVDLNNIPKTPEEYNELVKRKERERKYAPRPRTPVIEIKSTTDVLSDKFSLVQKGSASPKKLIEKYGIKSLPAWIIRVDGVDHLFEGVHNPAGFFDEYGNFIAQDDVERIINPKYPRSGEKISLKKDNVKIYIHKKSGDGIPLMALGNLENEPVLIQGTSHRMAWKKRIANKKRNYRNTAK